jgi:acylphosphatase
MLKWPFRFKIFRAEGFPMGEIRVEAHVVVTGKVQGVWFRAAAQAAARAEGLSGWVRNLPDRSVEALLQGEEGAVSRMVEWMRRGPPGARVTDIRIDVRPPGVTREGFEIRY